MIEDNGCYITEKILQAKAFKICIKYANVKEDGFQIGKKQRFKRIYL